MFCFRIGIAERYATTKKAEGADSPSEHKILVLQQVDRALINKENELDENIVELYQTVKPELKTREELLTSLRGRKRTVNDYAEKKIAKLRALLYPKPQVGRYLSVQDVS